MVIHCLDRAVAGPVDDIKVWLAKENDGVIPDMPGMAGAEHPYARAYSDPDPNRAVANFLLSEIARGLVRAHTVIIVPHTPCGCYEDFEGHGLPLKPEVERFHHNRYLPGAAAFLFEGHYQLTGRSNLKIGVLMVEDNETPSELGCSHRYEVQLAV
jgi:hypothetical protein